MALMKAFSEFSLESKERLIKVGLSPFKNICVICFNESPLKMMKRFLVHIKSSFRSQEIKFLLLVFGHIEKAT